MIPLRDDVESKTFPYVNWALIIANAYVFYVMFTLPGPQQLQAFVNHWAVIPKQLFANPSGHAYTLITAAFVHGGWLHIIFNMWFLYIFGDNVEDRMGHFVYLIFYFLLAVLANGSQAFSSPSSVIPMIGASGAIAGILGSYFFFYPHSKVLTLIPLGFFITIREIPAFFFLGLWFVLQAFNGSLAISSQLVTKQTMGGVAWWAHAAGFVWGLILSPLFGGKTSRYR